jgi:hypothetical protein
VPTSPIDPVVGRTERMQKPVAMIWLLCNSEASAESKFQKVAEFHRPLELK